LPGVLNVPIHNVAKQAVVVACIHLRIGPKISEKLVREIVSGIQWVRPVDSEIELTLYQSSRAFHILPKVPIEAGFNRVSFVDHSGGVREIEPKVVTRDLESSSEPYGRRVCDSGISYVWNQVVNIG